MVVNGGGPSYMERKLLEVVVELVEAVEAGEDTDWMDWTDRTSVAVVKRKDMMRVGAAGLKRSMTSPFTTSVVVVRTRDPLR